MYVIPKSIDISELAKAKARFMASLLVFTQTFFKIRTGREFELSEPIGRESHYLTIINALEKVYKGQTKRLIINVPPRYGKTELIIHFVSLGLGLYPDSNTIYVSYSHSLAKKQTQTVREIITLPEFKLTFGVELKEDAQAKDNFETVQGGSIYGVGAGGSITGRGAGIKTHHRYGGCIVIDDIHKPDEATSDTIREGILEWFYNTLQSRVNSPQTPIIYIGQRVHEEDLAAMLIESGEWELVSLPAIDEVGNALHPQMHDIRTLRKMQQESPYNFASQYQQDPQPSGGGIFKRDWFVYHDFEPDIIDTFITCDTAETDKNYNDATVFSFWGVYTIQQEYVDTGTMALHCLDCLEVRVEPKDLEPTFFNFYRSCMQYKVKPRLIGVETKSTGVTLASVLKKIQGIRILEIERTKASGSKTQRFLEAQPYISSGRLSLPTYSKHTKLVVDHMIKITANDTHAHDDICDTVADAIKIALIDELVGKRYFNQGTNNRVSAAASEKLKRLQKIRGGNQTERPFK